MQICSNVPEDAGLQVPPSLHAHHLTHQDSFEKKADVFMLQPRKNIKHLYSTRPSSPNTTKRSFITRDLARQRIGSRGLVVGGNRVVDVDLDARVCGIVHARNRHQLWARASRAARDGHLGTAEVELGTADRLGRVEGNVLRAEEVLAVFDAAGDGEGDSLGAYVFDCVSHAVNEGGILSQRTLSGPCQLATRHLWVILVNLEPVRARAIKRPNGLALGYLRQPSGEGSRVGKSVGNVEGDVAAGLDVSRSDVGAISRRQLVACHLGGGDIRGGSVALVVLGHANIFPVALFSRNVSVSGHSEYMVTTQVGRVEAHVTSRSSSLLSGWEYIHHC